MLALTRNLLLLLLVGEPCCFISMAQDEQTLRRVTKLPTQIGSSIKSIYKGSRTPEISISAIYWISLTLRNTGAISPTCMKKISRSFYLCSAECHSITHFGTKSSVELQIHYPNLSRYGYP